MPTGYARIVVAIDFSPSSLRALREARRLVRDGGEILLVHILRKMEPTLPFSSTNRKTVALLAQQAQADARIALDALAEEIHEVRIRTRVAVGVPHEKLLAEARRVKAEAIVIGAHGQTLSDRLLVGSTTERVVRKASVPVVVTPAQRKR